MITFETLLWLQLLRLWIHTAGGGVLAICHPLSYQPSRSHSAPQTARSEINYAANSSPSTTPRSWSNINLELSAVFRSTVICCPQFHKRHVAIDVLSTSLAIRRIFIITYSTETGAKPFLLFHIIPKPRLASRASIEEHHQQPQFIVATGATWLLAPLTFYGFRPPLGWGVT